MLFGGRHRKHWNLYIYIISYDWKRRCDNIFPLSNFFSVLFFFFFSFSRIGYMRGNRFVERARTRNWIHRCESGNDYWKSTKSTTRIFREGIYHRFLFTAFRLHFFPFDSFCLSILSPFFPMTRTTRYEEKLKKRRAAIAAVDVVVDVEKKAPRRRPFTFSNFLLHTSRWYIYNE